MDHPRVENLAGLVDDFCCYKILLLHLMGLKLISKFFSAAKQVFPVLHVVGLEFVRQWRCAARRCLGYKKSKIRPGVGREV